MELGEYVSKYRKEAGFSIDYLAEKSGVPKGTLNKIISGDTRSPTLETVIDIARALGKSLDDFLDSPPINEKNPVRKSENGQENNESRDLDEEFDNLLSLLDDNSKMVLIALLEKALKKARACVGENIKK